MYVYMNKLTRTHSLTPSLTLSPSHTHTHTEARSRRHDLIAGHPFSLQAREHSGVSRIVSSGHANYCVRKTAAEKMQEYRRILAR